MNMFGRFDLDSGGGGLLIGIQHYYVGLVRATAVANAGARTNSTLPESFL